MHSAYYNEKSLRRKKEGEGGGGGAGNRHLCFKEEGTITPLSVFSP